MHPLVVAAVGLALVMADARLALSETYFRGKDPVFQFQPPAGWTVKNGPAFRPNPMPQGMADPPPILSLRPGDHDGSMWVGLWSPSNAATIDEFRTRLDRLRPHLLQRSQITYSDRRVVGGLPVGVWAGHGWRNDNRYDVAFAAVQVAPRQLAVVTFIGEPDEFDRYETMLSDMLATVRPVGSSK